MTNKSHMYYKRKKFDDLLSNGQRQADDYYLRTVKNIHSDR